MRMDARGRSPSTPSAVALGRARRNSSAETTRNTRPCASRIVTGAMDSSAEGSRTLFMTFRRPSRPIGYSRRVRMQQAEPVRGVYTTRPGGLGLGGCFSSGVSRWVWACSSRPVSSMSQPGTATESVALSSAAGTNSRALLVFTSPSSNSSDRVHLGRASSPFRLATSLRGLSLLLRAAARRGVLRVLAEVLSVEPRTELYGVSRLRVTAARWLTSQRLGGRKQ